MLFSKIIKLIPEIVIAFAGTRMQEIIQILEASGNPTIAPVRFFFGMFRKLFPFGIFIDYLDRFWFRPFFFSCPCLFFQLPVARAVEDKTKEIALALSGLDSETIQKTPAVNNSLGEVLTLAISYKPKVSPGSVLPPLFFFSVFLHLALPAPISASPTPSSSYPLLPPPLSPPADPPRTHK
jgi:hypothetical protein